jgi:hypothetical protein
MAARFSAAPSDRPIELGVTRLGLLHEVIDMPGFIAGAVVNQQVKPIVVVGARASRK